VVDVLYDFSKGQAFERFRCYKQVHIVNSLLYILFIAYFPLFLLSFLFIVYFCMYVFFSFDANILVNKDVYYTNRDRLVIQILQEEIVVVV